MQHVWNIMLDQAEQENAGRITAREIVT